MNRILTADEGSLESIASNREASQHQLDALIGDLAMHMRRYDVLNGEYQALLTNEASIDKILEALSPGKPAEHFLSDPEICHAALERLLLDRSILSVSEQMEELPAIGFGHPLFQFLMKAGNVRVSSVDPERYHLTEIRYKASRKLHKSKNPRERHDDLTEATGHFRAMGVDTTTGGVYMMFEERVDERETLEYWACPIIDRNNDYTQAFSIKLV